MSAASPTDAWAVGAYYPNTTPTVLSTMAEHWAGHSWTELQLPNVGLNENTLLGVSELSPGKAWAVGYYVNASWVQQSLVEQYDGANWSVIPNPTRAKTATSSTAWPPMRTRRVGRRYRQRRQLRMLTDGGGSQSH